MINHNKGGDLFMHQAIVMLAIASIIALCPATSGYCAGESGPVPKTGQAQSFATADDGQLQKGMVWPGFRFSEMSDGTVFDGLTSLFWMKNASCWGSLSWNAALTKINELNNGTTSCSGFSGKQNDWRLPNINELESLIDSSRLTPALPVGHPFASVNTSNYWTSSTYAGNTSNAWCVNIDDGYVEFKDYMISNGVWPVRGGQRYSQQDLSGTWNYFSLVSGDVGQNQVPGWSFGSGVFNSTGLPENQSIVSTDSSLGSKTFPSSSSLLLAVDPSSGKLYNSGSGKYGKISRDKNVMTIVGKGNPGSQDGVKGYFIDVLVKSGGTYSAADLDGTWAVFGLFVGDAPAQLEGWSYRTYTSTSGQVTAKTTTSSGLSECGFLPDTMTIASDGRILTSNATASGAMSQTKDFFVITATDDWTAKSSCATDLKGYSMHIGIKKGSSLGTADLNGEWVETSLSAGDVAKAMNAGWGYGEYTVTNGFIKKSSTVQSSYDSKEKIVVKNAVEHFGNVTVSGAGEVSGGPALHYSVMGASKNLMAVVQTDGKTPKLALWMRK
ncbi:MAG: DUF1566 domain-containing protein [Magnetococcales bacterium]|nr:DUF1566 domain-containing protein [Magnetococcales bacterium]MBF0151328.1 DUF1566 domain-containing protein [Magnetococcales bacterium]